MRQKTKFIIHLLPALIMLNVFPFNGDTKSEESQNPYPKLTMVGFVQQHFTYDETPESAAGFSIHRARLGVAGLIARNISFNLVIGGIEPPDGSPRLVNAQVDFHIHQLFNVRAGQFLVPFGLEGPEVIIFNPAIERSTTVRRLNTFMLFRDIGIQIRGSHSVLKYGIALVNGTGANIPERIDPKNIVGRIGLKPVEELEVGISGHFGRYQPDPTINDDYRRFRIGFDFNAWVDDFFARGEYIVREDDLPGGESVTARGGYLLGGYAITPRWEAIARYEYYEPDGNGLTNHFTSVTAGFNYYFKGQTRLSINYEFRDDNLNQDLGNLLTIQMQYAL